MAHQGHPPPGYGAPPPPPAVVIGAQYCLPYPTFLIMKEKLSWTRDDMDILDTQGVCHFKLRTKVFSMHGKRALLDPTGRPVCCIMGKIFSLHSTTYICPAEDYDESKCIAEVKKTILSLTPNLKVYLAGNTSGAPDYEVDGSFFAHEFTIKNHANMVVAQVSRNFTMESVFLSKDTYMVQIFAGADIAFITTLVTIIEEAIVEKKQENNSLF